ncbi:hypothetical protein HYPDE_38463 [Hyphomicrobium denitrificans 1NES1]|uniref:Flagellar FliJ protein n=1 Tax=Hyphomicrobium denitrificans 1NES1 TaxID=670307 RepID=N0BAT5_9HYPH|nr:hypothetical protein [Hyphomicrobium denitrificans]AGK59362.1 hypothetical protein HYPDE_38463 [Hyphomicrobium denitrificans 1NES1]
MASAIKKLRRLADVFHDLETVERVRVSELTREIASLRATQDDILRSLENPSTINGLFTALLSSRVGRLERRIQQLSREREIALKRYAEAAARGRSAGRLLAEARGEEARKREQAELEALLEFKESVAAQGRGKSPRSI